MEPAEYIHADDYIDTIRATDWGAIDHILVGGPTDLTTSDVFGRLNDFAEAFVLLYEIELDLRDSLQVVNTKAQLGQRYRDLPLFHRGWMLKLLKDANR
jgi:hypothetical protein